MSEKVRKIALFGLLFVAVIWGYYNTIGQKSKPAPQALQSAQQAAMPKQTVTPIVVDTKPVETSAWSDDPFNRETDTTAIKSPISGNGRSVRPAVQFTLKAIIYNENARSAYLNGSVVREGDEINGAVVETIERTKVILRRNGESFAVTINRG